MKTRINERNRLDTSSSGKTPADEPCGLMGPSSRRRLIGSRPSSATSQTPRLPARSGYTEHQGGDEPGGMGALDPSYYGETPEFYLGCRALIGLLAMRRLLFRRSADWLRQSFMGRRALGGGDAANRRMARRSSSSGSIVLSGVLAGMTPAATTRPSC
jgi:hypothetical protein